MIKAALIILHFLLFGLLSATVVISFWRLGKTYVVTCVIE